MGKHRKNNFTKHNISEISILKFQFLKHTMLSRCNNWYMYISTLKNIWLTKSRGKRIFNKMKHVSFVPGVCIHIYHTTNGCEIWILKETKNKRLEVFEMWCWKFMERISWIERKINKKVFQNVKEKRTFMDVIKARRWKMIGYVLRLHEELYNIIIMEGMVYRNKTRTFLKLLHI